MFFWVYFLELLLSFTCVWLGLYIYTRNRGLHLTRYARYLSVGLVIFSFYFLGNGLMAIAPSADAVNLIKKATWWSSPVSVAMWLNIIVLLIASYYKDWFVSLMLKLRWGFLALGVLLGVLGVCTELIYQYSATDLANLDEGFFYGKYLIPPAAPPFDVFDGYLVFTIGLTLICVLLWQRHVKKNDKIKTSERVMVRRYLWLAIAISIAAVANVLTYTLRWFDATFYTDLGFFFIPVILSLLIVNHTSISAKEKPMRDFAYSFAGFILFLFFLLIVPNGIAKLLEITLGMPVNYLQIALAGWGGTFALVFFDDLGVVVNRQIAGDHDERRQIILMWETSLQSDVTDDLRSMSDIIKTYVNKDLIKKLFTQAPSQSGDLMKTSLIKLVVVNKKLVDMGVDSSLLTPTVYQDAVKSVVEEAHSLLKLGVVYLPENNKKYYLDILGMKIFKGDRTSSIAKELHLSKSQVQRFYSEAVEYLVQAILYLELDIKRTRNIKSTNYYYIKD